MQKGKIIIEQETQHRTTLYPYYTKEAPKGSILILHGMAEHRERYQEFALFLNRSGYDVFLYDHRGHGADEKLEDLGYISDHQGDKLLINDAITILKYIKKTNRGKKLFLFSHSMGSLIARNVITFYDDFDGVIFCGSTYKNSCILYAGLFVASLIRVFQEPKHHSRWMNKLLFGGKCFTKQCVRTSFDWLSRDNKKVGAYVHDPLCGFLCSISFYQDLLHLALSAGKTKCITQVRKDLPILFLSGSHDPVSNNGKEISKLYDTYQKLGFTDVSCTLYEECRHELLNELNHTKIMQDICHWIDNH